MRGQIQRFIISTLLFLLVFSCPFAGCTNVSGASHATLNKVSGQVSLQRANTDAWVGASAGASLQQGDRIRTGPGSTAVIIFFEGSITEVSADSEVGLDEMRREGGSTVVKIREEIGTTSSRVEKLIDAGSRFEVETPAGSALVRGSVMGVIVLENGTTIIDAIQGQCWAVAQGVEVLVPEGMRSIIYRGSAPGGASSSSGAVTPPAVNTGQSGQAPAFFNIEPYEDPAGSETVGEVELIDLLLPMPCQMTPQVVTVGLEFDEGEYPYPYILRLMGTLVDMCPGTTVYVSFIWTTGGDPDETELQLMTEPGNFSFDLAFDYPPLYASYRAKADGGSNGVGYGEVKYLITATQIP